MLCIEAIDEATGFEFLAIDGALAIEADGIETDDTGIDDTGKDDTGTNDTGTAGIGTAGIGTAGKETSPPNFFISSSILEVFIGIENRLGVENI